MSLKIMLTACYNGFFNFMNLYNEYFLAVVKQVKLLALNGFTSSVFTETLLCSFNFCSFC